MNIIFKGSPNFWPKRVYGGKQYSVKKIVIHWFGVGTLESANARFQNPSASASAHYGISKGRIWQWVKEHDAAWHAGNGLVNLESIGIEHDAGVDPKHDLAEQDYQLSAQLVADIAKRYNIPLDRSHVIKHSEVKATQCCGTVNVDRIIEMAKAINNPSPVPQPQPIPAPVPSPETPKSQKVLVFSRKTGRGYLVEPMFNPTYMRQRAAMEGLELKEIEALPSPDIL